VSIPVDLASLEDTLKEFGSAGFLVTTNPDVTPHVVSVSIEVVDGNLEMGLGRRSRANTVGSPAVTLVWPGVGDYCLIVDGTARKPGESDDTLVVRPTSAMLHRLATASPDLPTGCRRRAWTGVARGRRDRRPGVRPCKPASAVFAARRSHDWIVVTLGPSTGDINNRSRAHWFMSARRAVRSVGTRSFEQTPGIL
jgi:hypothetical protein